MIKIGLEMNLEEKIEFLINDHLFGCLTRQGLELHLSEFPIRSEKIFVIDLDNIHHLNKEIGYDAVNTKIWNVCFNLKRTYGVIIGRIFSGDELAILPLNTECGLKEIKEQFHMKKIGFKCIESEIVVGTHILDIRHRLDEITSEMHKCRYCKIV